jgi:hypothetical protein
MDTLWKTRSPLSGAAIPSGDGVRLRPANALHRLGPRSLTEGGDNYAGTGGHGSGGSRGRRWLGRVWGHPVIAPRAGCRSAPRRFAPRSISSSSTRMAVGSVFGRAWECHPCARSKVLPMCRVAHRGRAAANRAGRAKSLIVLSGIRLAGWFAWIAVYYARNPSLLGSRRALSPQSRVPPLWK